MKTEDPVGLIKTEDIKTHDPEPGIPGNFIISSLYRKDFSLMSSIPLPAALLNALSALALMQAPVPVPAPAPA